MLVFDVTGQHLQKLRSKIQLLGPSLMFTAALALATFGQTYLAL